MSKYFPLVIIVILLLCNIAAFAQSSGSAVKPAEPIDEKNKQIAEINEAVQRTFTAGNAALRAGNYDEAIKQYDEGLTAYPEHPGVPSLLTNKSVALRARGAARYNKAVAAKDAAAKDSGLQSAKEDFRLATETSTRAVDTIKALPAPTDAEALTAYNANKYFALLARFEAMRLFALKVDQSKANEAFAAYQEYMEVETEPARKDRAQHDEAQMLFNTNQYDKSLIEYRKILAQHPDDPDANVGVGIDLFALGDKTKYQDAANHIQRFLDVAPAAHNLRASAQEILDNLKTANIVPQKTRP